MFNRNQLTACRFTGIYPTVPAAWPNRQVRRAVQKGRDSRLPPEWRAFLSTRPAMRDAIKSL